ncbi:MAG: hypothetical protein FD166_1432 [Bacteroidetes bacterium]|nr:MAG: hypothetical protein FD166_1432 [Bacteroidota bacterium]
MKNEINRSSFSSGEGVRRTDEVKYREFCPNCAFGGCEPAEKLVQDPQLNAIKCPHWKGLWKYRTLPEGMRPATIRDFFEGDQIKPGVKYLLHSFYSGHYESYTASLRTDQDDLRVFIEKGRCFIKSI